MESYLILYNLINIFCMLFIGLFMIFSNRGIHNKIQKRVLKLALSGLLVLFLSDTLWYSMDQGGITQNLVMSYFLKTIYFLSSCYCGFMWFVYFEVTIKSDFLKKKKMIFYSSSLLIIGFVLLIINIFTGIIFKLEWNNGALVYSRGILFPLIYAIIYVYIVVSSIRCIYCGLHNEVDRAKYFIIATFPVVPFICAGIQYFYWRLPVACIGLVLSVSICYLEAIEEQISVDPQLDINNRRKILFYVHKAIHSSNTESLYLFMMDLDKFKSINDTYGHLIGDQALLIATEQIRKVLLKYNKSQFGRYGGDEFIIVCNISDPNLLINDIKEVLEEASSDLEYKLSISIGYAKYDKSIKNIKDFILVADNMLYEEKEAKAVD